MKKSVVLLLLLLSYFPVSDFGIPVVADVTFNSPTPTVITAGQSKSEFEINIAFLSFIHSA